ncbi:hypothetical protein D9M71_620420 [compost metagenome]
MGHGVCLGLVTDRHPVGDVDPRLVSAPGAVAGDHRLRAVQRADGPVGLQHADPGAALFHGGCGRPGMGPDRWPCQAHGAGTVAGPGHGAGYARAADCLVARLADCDLAGGRVGLARDVRGRHAGGVAAGGVGVAIRAGLPGAGCRQAPGGHAGIAHARGVDRTAGDPHLDPWP